MKRILFAFTAAFFMVLIGFSSISVSADSDGVIYGTVHGVYENDWGELIKDPLAGVKITITRSDGDSRIVYTDSYGHFEHTVNYADYKNYIVEADPIDKDIVVDGEAKTYTFGAETEYIRRWDWKPWPGQPTTEIDIDMIGKENTARNLPVRLFKMELFDFVKDLINARLFEVLV